MINNYTLLFNGYVIACPCGDYSPSMLVKGPQNGHSNLPRNGKQTYRLNYKASNLTIRFDFGHDLDLEFSRSNMEFPISQPKVVETKSKISIELQASNVTNGVDLDHNLDLRILKVKRDLDLWTHTWPWLWISMVKFWNSCIAVWEGRLTLHKGVGSRSFMTITMTIW